MYRLLTPILAFIVAFTLFFTFIQPTFDEYKRIDIEMADYDQALASAQKLQERVNELIAEKNAIAQSDLERLMTFLPNSIDEVGIVLTLDDLSSRHDLALEQISVESSRSRGAQKGNTATADFAFDDSEEDVEDKNVRPDGSIAKDPLEAIETIKLSFSITGTYENFRKLVSDLESSLSLMDIVSLSVDGMQEDNIATYAVTVAMYQFNDTE